MGTGLQKEADLSAQVQEKKEKSIQEKNKQNLAGWRRKPFSSLRDICIYLKSFPIKFIMNLIQSPMAQRNVLSNKKALLRDR